MELAREQMMALDGIVLNRIERERSFFLFTLFTQQNGLVQVGGYGKKAVQCLQPGVRVDLTVEINKKGYYSYKEGVILENYFLNLKQLNELEVGCSLLGVAFHCQWIEDPAPAIYQLLHLYLSSLETCKDPWVLLLSFQLKLLKYQGLIVLPPSCSVCETTLTAAAYFQGGQWLCHLHRSKGEIYEIGWNEEELMFLQLLAHSRSLEHLNVHEVNLEERKKIEKLFYALLPN